MNFLHQRMGETLTSTYGSICGPDEREICKILERGEHNPDHVRIPAGAYQIGRKPFGSSEFDSTFSQLIGPSYKGILWLPEVPGRTNIELHTANFVEQLLGCLATGTSIGHDATGDYCIPGGQSRPAYRALYMAISPQIDLGGATLSIKDIASAALIV